MILIGNLGVRQRLLCLYNHNIIFSFFFLEWKFIIVLNLNDMYDT